MRALLAPLGLPFVPSSVVAAPREAAEAAARLGTPVALKVFSDHAVHKSDLGLVVLGAVSGAEVEAAYRGLTCRVAELELPDTQIVVQPMAPAGIDMFLGYDRDPVFGPAVVVGMGGTTVELYRDIARRLPPMTAEDVAGMLSSLRSAPLLDGYRGADPVDMTAFLQLAAMIAELAIGVPELTELDLNPIRVLPDGSCLLLDAAGALTAAIPDTTAMAATAATVGGTDLQALLEPASVAVVGASRTETRPGARILRSLRDHGFPGALYAVNPAVGEVGGLAAFESLSALPEVPDLVCVALAAAPSVEAVRDCVRLGVPAVIVFASGFAESGPVGRALDDELRAAVTGSATLLCGPNTIGVVNAHLPMAATFSQALTGFPLRTGGTSLIAQSGAVAGSLVSRELAEGYGIGDWVTVGNQSGLDVADYIAHFAARKSTTALAVFLEGVPDGARFRAALRIAREADKPVVVFKTGTTEVGRRAVASHSGALAGSETVYHTLLDQEGVERVDRMSALLPLAWTLGTVHRPAGRRVAVITTSGGAGSATADLVAGHGLEMATLSERTVADISPVLPAFAQVENPLDVTAEGAFAAGAMRRVVELVAEDPGVDLVCVVLTSITGADAVRIASEIAAADGGAAPVLVTWLVARQSAADGMDLLAAHGLRVFAEPSDMVSAAARLIARPRKGEK
jgi:acyl-CoA synthetase (NDP forming)